MMPLKLPEPRIVCYQSGEEAEESARCEVDGRSRPRGAPPDVPILSNFYIRKRDPIRDRGAFTRVNDRVRISENIPAPLLWSVLILHRLNQYSSTPASKNHPPPACPEDIAYGDHPIPSDSCQP